MYSCQYGTNTSPNKSVDSIDHQHSVASKFARQTHKSFVSIHRYTFDGRKLDWGHPLGLCHRKFVANSCFSCHTNRSRSAKKKKNKTGNIRMGGSGEPSPPQVCIIYLDILLHASVTIQIPAQREYLRRTRIVHHFMARPWRWSFEQFRSFVNQRPRVPFNVVAPQVAQVFETIPSAIQIHHTIRRVDDQLMAATHAGPLFGIDGLLQHPRCLVVLIREVCVHQTVYKLTKQALCISSEWR